MPKQSGYQKPITAKSSTAADMVDAYIMGQIERLFYMRNAGLPRAGKRAAYAGPQTAMLPKRWE